MRSYEQSPLPRPSAAIGRGKTRWIRIGLHLLAAVARRDLFLRRVLCSGFLDHLANHFTVAGHERRDLLEAVAVPLLELHHSRAFVIRAARLYRREETG